MLDRSQRADTPAEPGGRTAEQNSSAREDLRARLDRLPDVHPSAAEYSTGDFRDSGQRPLRASDQSAEPAESADEPNALESGSGVANSNGVATDSRQQPADSQRLLEDTEADRDTPDPERDTPDPERDTPDADAERGTDRADHGWQAAEVRDEPSKPPAEGIHVPPDRSPHILAGDGPGTPGGGHRHGSGRPGKTEFPGGWEDEDILSAVEEVARQPDSVERQPNGRWRVTGQRDDVSVTAVVLPDGRIWTAWPEPGGPGVTKNPEKGGA
jgi:Bacterial EndoU nuclease